jgi:hypothetical protein
VDTLVAEALAEGRGEADIHSAVDDYFAIGTFLDKGLERQTQLDLSSFELATGRRLEAAERAEFVQVQHQANRWTFLGSGMTHPNVIATFDRLSGTARERLQERALALA